MINETERSPNDDYLVASALHTGANFSTELFSARTVETFQNRSMCFSRFNDLIPYAITRQVETGSGVGRRKRSAALEVHRDLSERNKLVRDNR